MDVALEPSTSRLVAGFPFPFPADTYRYSTNVEPAREPVPTPAGRWGTGVLDIDDEYQSELAERERILGEDPSRHVVLSHMRDAAWDTVLTLLGELTTIDPGRLVLTRLGRDRWRWENRILGQQLEFTYGDDDTLPDEPLRFIASQVQEDIVLLDQRADQLWCDAGVVTFAADWSFGFDVGMSFLEIHGPVPRLREERIITRAHDFLRRLQPHDPYRRTNWTLTIGRRLDVSTERYPDWGPDRERIQRVDDATFGSLVHLRVEVQHLIRLPESGAILFLIRTYLLPLRDLVTVEPWRRRMVEVLEELPEDLAAYKGIDKYRDRAAAWLRIAGDGPANRPPDPNTDPPTEH